MNEEFALKLIPILNSLRAYHRHEVVGLANLPSRGPVIVATNHSLATYDLALLMAEVFEKTKRFPRSLVDRLFYRIPGIASLMETLGCVVGSPENARSLLSNGEILYLAPGGMREALKSSDEKYQIFWHRRKGFARLAIAAQAPVILAACPHADDLYTIYNSKITRWAYQNYRIPFFFAKGVGHTPLPQPVKLIHLLSEPIYPPGPGSNSETQVNLFHGLLVERMNELMLQARDINDSHRNPQSFSESLMQYIDRTRIRLLQLDSNR